MIICLKEADVGDGGKSRRIPHRRPLLFCLCCALWLAMFVTELWLPLPPLPLPFLLRLWSFPSNPHPMDWWVLTEINHRTHAFILSSVECSSHCVLDLTQPKLHQQACNGLNLDLLCVFILVCEPTGYTKFEFTIYLKKSCVLTLLVYR